MSPLQRIQAIIAPKTSHLQFRSNDLDGSLYGPLALLQPLLKGTSPAPIGLVGYNANGKTSTAESNTIDTMPTDDEYQDQLLSLVLEPEESVCMEYEQDRQELDEPCSSDGASLLAAGKYIAPTAIDLDIREGKLSPVLDAGDSTRAITAWTWGLCTQVALIYITRSKIKEAVSYLSQIHEQLQDQDLTAPASLHQTYDIPLLRLGLQLVGKDIKNCQSDDGVNAVLETVRCLQPAEIRIPRKCWELAGTVRRFYPEHSRPLSEQLEQLSEFLWRNTTCYKQEDIPSGNQHLAYLTGVLVTVPSRWLQGVLVLDHVGYIPGDAACAETYSQLDKYACNILAVADSRAATVNRALQLLEKSRTLQQLAAKVPNTPRVLVLMAAEKTTELLKHGQNLEAAVQTLAKKGSAAELHSCLQAAKQWLQQLGDGSTLDEPEAKQVAARAGLKSLNPAQQLMLRMYNLLQSRKRHEVEWLARPVIDELRHKGWRGSTQADLQAAGVLTLAWWPRTYHAIKGILQQYQEHLGPDTVQEACAVFAEVTGIAALQQFVSSSTVCYRDKQAEAAIEAFDSTCEQFKELVPLVTDQLQNDMLTLLQGSLASQSTAETERQEALSKLEKLQRTGFELGPDSLAALQELVCAAVRQELQPHLSKCTMERGLAEGIRMVMGEDINDIPDWKQQLGYDMEPPAGALVGPAEYTTELKRALTKLRAFKHWLHCDQVDNSITRLSENITKTPAVAECVLTPLQEVFSCVDHRPFITLPELQQQCSRADHTHSAQLKLGQIASALKSALQPTGSARAVIEPQLQALRSQIPSIIKSAFQGLLDFDRLMYPTIMQAMTENLYIGIASTLVAAYKSILATKLKLLNSRFSELTAAMLQAVGVKVKEVVAMCWEKLLHEVEVQIIRPLRFLQADQQHQQQLLQQPGGLTKAVGEVVQLRCFMAANQSNDMYHGDYKIPAAVLGAQASSSKVSAQQNAIPVAVLQLLLDDPVDFWNDTVDQLLPQTCDLQHLASSLCALAEQQCSALGTDLTIRQLLQRPAWIQQCARAVHLDLRLPNALSKADVIQLWLSALPGAVRIQELQDVVCGRLRATSDAGTTDGAVDSVVSDTCVIGSEPYMKLLMELITKEKLPWKLSDLRTIISPQLTKLTTDGVLLPGQLISSLLPSVQQQIAIELYLGCYVKARGISHTVHSQRVVDALVPLSRLVPVPAADTAAGGSAAQGSAPASSDAPASAAAAGNNVSSILSRISEDRIVVGSCGQMLLRVSQRPLAGLTRTSVRATHVVLPVCDATGNNRIATVKLNRDTEFLLCGTRTHCKTEVTNAVLQRLDRQAPPVVMLAAAMLLQAEEQAQQDLQQQQPLISQGSGRCSRSGTAGSSHHFTLSRPCSQLWYNRLRAALQRILIERNNCSTGPTSVPEVLQEQHWDVIESLYGRARFYYTGPLPAELFSGPGSSSSAVAGSTVTVGFEDFAAALTFARTGRLHNGLKYLETYRHKSMLRQLAKVTAKDVAAEAAQQSRATGSEAATSTPRRKRPAEALAAASGSPASGSKRHKAVAGSALKHITIGEVVAVTPELQSDQPIEVFIRPSVSNQPHIIKLSTQGAFLPRHEAAATADATSDQAGQSGAAAGAVADWYGPIKTPNALIRELVGLSSRGWRDIYSANGTSWKHYKEAAQRLRQPAATASDGLAEAAVADGAGGDQLDDATMRSD